MGLLDLLVDASYALAHALATTIYNQIIWPAELCLFVFVCLWVVMYCLAERDHTERR